MERGLNVMVGGEAGQGVQSVGFILAKAFARGGFHVFADQDYESRVRGGHNFFRVRVSAGEVAAISEEVDILLALNEESVGLHRSELAAHGAVVFDGEKARSIAAGGNLVSAPLARLAQEKGGSSVMANTVALGVGLGLVGYDPEIMAEAVRHNFGTGESGESNVRAAMAGYEYATVELKGLLKERFNATRGESRMLLNGSEAIALGAVAAGCTFMAAYPMTPATPIMEFLAGKSHEIGPVVVQPEDEIAAMNMTIGAAFAGARAMTATSGSGFALMVEGLGLAGITETPIVAVLAQRPAPAVGLPTRTEQGDLQFVLTAAPGEFPRAVVAPATVEEAFWLTVKAFNLADRYQLPVIMLTDHHLASSYATVPTFDLSRVTIDRGELLRPDDIANPDEYKRHRITPSGISPRALPSQGKALVVTDADEHDEEGHPIEDADMRTQMMLKRLRKLDGLEDDIAPPRVYGPDRADTTLVGWGSTYGALREAIDTLRDDGLDANLLHLSELWPFPAQAVVQAIETAGRSLVVESNATGQLARLIRSETGIKLSGSILKFDGRPFTPADIVREVTKEVTQ
jgi:2-oxoglutarate ferredoxin oxidoreductase subunit alpha